MKNVFLVITLSVATVVLASSAKAGLPGLLTAKHQDWSFIESVGGMKVALDKNQLRVSCNVSGLETITRKPTHINSAMGVRKLKVSRVGSTIQLSVVTSVIEKGMSTTCGITDLSTYPPGAYTVVYLNPDGTTHLLGTVTQP